MNELVEFTCSLSLKIGRIHLVRLLQFKLSQTASVSDISNRTTQTVKWPEKVRYFP
jgi:hypothetical protein